MENELSALEIVTEDIAWLLSFFISLLVLGQAISVPLSSTLKKLAYPNEFDAISEIERLRKELVADRLVALFEVIVNSTYQVIRAVTNILLGYPVLIVLLILSLAAGVWSSVYGVSFLHTMFQIYNDTFALAMGVFKKGVAIVLLSWVSILPVLNSVVFFFQGLVKISVTAVSECTFMAIAESAKDTGLGLYAASIQTGKLVTSEFDVLSLNYTDTYLHFGDALLQSRKVSKCVCSDFDAFMNITTQPLVCPQTYSMLSNATLGLLSPLQGVHAVWTLENQKWGDLFILWENVIVDSGIILNDFINAISSLVVYGNTDAKQQLSPDFNYVRRPWEGVQLPSQLTPSSLLAYSAGMLGGKISTSGRLGSIIWVCLLTSLSSIVHHCRCN